MTLFAWFLIIGITATWFAFYYFGPEDTYDSYWFWWFVRKYIFIMVILFIVMYIANGFDNEERFQIVETKETIHTLVSLGARASLEGKFFLGTGKVGENPRYYFMREEVGGYRMACVTTHNTLVIEDNNETPRVEKVRVVNKAIKPRFFKYDENKHTSYRIYIPENSITRDFKIDVNNL